VWGDVAPIQGDYSDHYLGFTLSGFTFQNLRVCPSDIGLHCATVQTWVDKVLTQ